MDSETEQNLKPDHGGTETLNFTPQRGGTLLAARKRTLRSGHGKVNSSFKSPVQVSCMLNSGVCVEEEIRALQNTLLQLESDITLLESDVGESRSVRSAVLRREQLSDKTHIHTQSQKHFQGMCVHELELHINLLHEYNDIKDIAQTLLGRLAGLRGVTTRDLYAQFGMELDD